MKESNSVIKAYRKAARLTQEELAKKIGVSRQAVNGWETGQYKPSDSNIVLIAKALNVPPDKLYQEYYNASKTASLDNKPTSLIRLYENSVELVDDKPSSLVTVNYDDPASLIAVRVNDDAMHDSNLPKGSVAVIRTKGFLRNGMMALLSVASDVPKIAYVYIEDDTLTVKYSTKKSPEEKYDLKKTAVDFIGRVIGYMGDL